jgi:hypothetical protein
VMSGCLRHNVWHLGTAGRQVAAGSAARRPSIRRVRRDPRVVL